MGMHVEDKGLVRLNQIRFKIGWKPTPKQREGLSGDIQQKTVNAANFFVVQQGEKKVLTYDSKVGMAARRELLIAQGDPNPSTSIVLASYLQHKILESYGEAIFLAYSRGSSSEFSYLVDLATGSHMMFDEIIRVEKEGKMQEREDREKENGNEVGDSSDQPHDPYQHLFEKLSQETGKNSDREDSPVNSSRDDFQLEGAQLALKVYQDILPVVDTLTFLA